MTVEENFQLGIDNHKKNDHLEAIKYYNKALELDPNHLGSLNNLGLIYDALGDYLKAISYFEKLTEIDKNNEMAFGNLLNVHHKLKDTEKTFNTLEKLLQVRSKKTQAFSKEKLDSVIPKLVKKLQEQNGIPTFFDNGLINFLTNKNFSNYDYCNIFENGQISKNNRFTSYSERIKKLPGSNPLSKIFTNLPYDISQGVHSLITWKEIPIYKTVFDLAIYPMMLQEIKPDIIIELGSGSGGSAIWLADTAAALGINTHIYSFDINKPEIKHDNVTFIKQNLNKINQNNKPECWERFIGKKIILEDAHVNLKEILFLFDNILEKDDYLIIEDSEQKQEIISNFLNKKETKYKLDQFYLDFFGTNITCSNNSILKCI